MKLKHAERLIKLANYLGKMRNKNWEYWSVFEKLKGVKSCSSKGCAIGHAPILFPNSCQHEKADEWDNIITFGVVGKGNYKGFSGEKFSEKFFGLSHREAQELFWGDGCDYNVRLGTTKKAIVDSIVNLVKRNNFKVTWVDGKRIVSKS